MPAVQNAPTSDRVTALAWLETKRFARHPVFLVGAVICTLLCTVGLAGSQPTEDFYSGPLFPAFFLGVFGMVVGFRLTQSMQRAAEAVESTPVPPQARVAALLMACLLPAAVGLATFVALLTISEAKGAWVYGTWSSSDRVAIFFGEAVVAALGGPLLGVAAARWLRFPGAVVVPVVAVVTWVVVGNSFYSNHQVSSGALWMRLFSPFAFFTTLDTGSKPHAVESWLGSPWWFLAWLLLLCAVAALVALLRGAQGHSRDTLRRSLLVVVVLAIGCYVLAVTQGPAHNTVSTPVSVSTLH